MSTQACIDALKSGPKTARELAELTDDDSGNVARNTAWLIYAEKAIRIDGGSGRGSKAVYALTGFKISKRQYLTALATVREYRRERGLLDEGHSDDIDWLLLKLGGLQNDINNIVDTLLSPEKGAD